ncbi:centriolar and ciliogenesis-associated protein HYLS1-like isoform X2 [Biomphalaria glabrata]|nr:centriolar and ciliogenesis-associated protein HYLS1-like isoform X2 [Biomphalaria glabrata]XP_013069290.1 centriolar and ciliogenesis-associated protein HYLS1-like isoform X2 [Biomphalaria glabrata]XP_013069291.1 centriolar and ciliogenesis-associated protein HYLS1-like isoform X2 [Biomphalaria glabrata]
MEFTDSEIREELARLGYRDVPDNKLAEFKKDLMKLITAEKSKSNSLNGSAEVDYFHSKPDSEYHVISEDYSHPSKGKTYTFNEPVDGYRENWHYRGLDEDTEDSPDYSYNKATRAPGSYSLYEMPDSSRSDNIYCPNYDNVNNSVHDDAFLETGFETKHLKRKTSRKTSNGKSSQVVDKSSNACDMADLYALYERVKNMAIRDCECGQTVSAASESSYCMRGPKKKTSIIKIGEPPHTRNLVRIVPFKRHQMYQRLWKLQPAIGDDVRYHTRKTVHAKMLKREDIKMFHKVFVPNPYVVPTDKPRYNLRWKVRKANALYEMPPHGFYHEV